ncbi:MAG: DUF1460 domain-containing protein [Syntrophorhabdaceae bacterium]|nr:DUF1460 domain-containing protein [Syntrophorhabdaceae bacterium]
MEEYINLGRWGVEGVEGIIEKASAFEAIQDKIDYISRCFLGIPYRESTLIGSAEEREVFVIDLEGADCLTYIEYVEALRLSHNFYDFREELKNIRYRSGVVSYSTRNHFFTDWRENKKKHVEDVTGIIGMDKAYNRRKLLNIREDGSLILKGIPPFAREVWFIPGFHVNGMIDSLETGDYCGIYSEDPGLDVSHVGIIIKKEGGILLRHASSKEGKRRVLDEAFLSYIKDIPGIIILRPL